MSMNTTKTPESRISFKRLLPLLIIGFVATVGFFALRDVLSFEALAENREMLNAWRDENYLLAVLTFVAVYVVVVAFSLPGATIMTLTGGFLFSTFPGTLFNITGATLGAIAIFLAAKTGLGDALHSKLQDGAGDDGFMAKMEAGLHKNEISYLLLMRLVPAVPFFLANLAPAFLGVKLKNFALTTFFGIMPGAVVYTSVGAGLGDVFARGETPNLGIIFEWQVLGPILGLSVLAALPIVIGKFTDKKDQ
jgi:uncharacterized membrane protein YdjX (TVP38/TMEM64 family)